MLSWMIFDISDLITKTEDVWTTQADKSSPALFCQNIQVSTNLY